MFMVQRSINCPPKTAAFVTSCSLVELLRKCYSSCCRVWCDVALLRIFKVEKMGAMAKPPGKAVLQLFR